MNKQKIKNSKRIRRRKKIRAKIIGNSTCPRLSVFKSNKGMYAQLIDDKAGKTLISASSIEIKKEKKKVALSFKLGELIAKKALEAKIEKIVFDRGGYKYHGRVKALADGAREGGLKF